MWRWDNVGVKHIKTECHGTRCLPLEDEKEVTYTKLQQTKGKDSKGK